MDHLRLITALRKSGITNITEPGNDPCGRFIAQNAAGVPLIWWTQEGRDGRLTAQCVHWPSPYTDTQTDCFCDRYFRTIKSAVLSLSPQIKKAG